MQLGLVVFEALLGQRKQPIMLSLHREENFSLLTVNLYLLIIVLFTALIPDLHLSPPR